MGWSLELKSWNVHCPIRGRRTNSIWHKTTVLHFRDGKQGGRGVHDPLPPDFGRSVNPISNRGADYAHHITTGTPRFSELPTALYFKTSFKTEKWRLLLHHRKILLTYTIILSDLQKAAVCCDKKRSKTFLKEWKGAPSLHFRVGIKVIYWGVLTTVRGTKDLEYTQYRNIRNGK